VILLLPPCAASPTHSIAWSSRALAGAGTRQRALTLHLGFALRWGLHQPSSPHRCSDNEAVRERCWELPEHSTSGPAGEPAPPPSEVPRAGKSTSPSSPAQLLAKEVLPVPTSSAWHRPDNVSRHQLAALAPEVAWSGVRWDGRSGAGDEPRARSPPGAPPAWQPSVDHKLQETQPQLWMHQQKNSALGRRRIRTSQLVPGR